MTENGKKLWEAISEREELKEKASHVRTKEELIEIAEDHAFCLGYGDEW